MNSSVVALRIVEAAQHAAGPGKRASTPANQRALDHLRRADQQQRDQQHAAPATSSIRNENSLCFQKLRCFSTPQA